MSDPILREHTGVKTRIRARGGLHYIRGNHAPYFSLTYDEYEKTTRGWRYVAGGANHDEILKLWPDLADLAAMHLSDMDGAPIHAEANGWYHLAGYFPDAFGERYHRGNSKRHFADGYRMPTSDECLEAFADHCRVTMAEAREIAEQVRKVAMAAHDNRNAVARAECARLLDAMRQRWKREAEACIAKHGLVVYGDPWTHA